MTRKINSFSFLLICSLFLLSACQKENIYEAINNKTVQKTDPFIALDRITDTPVILGKVILNNDNEVEAGWLIDKKAKLYQFQLAENASFPTRTTEKSELLLETILQNTTEIEAVNAEELLLRSRQLEEISHIPPVYRSGEPEGNTSVYFTFGEVDNTTCENNGVPISFVTAAGCEADASNLVNCVTETSMTTLIIQASGQASATLPNNIGTPLVEYMDKMVAKSESVDAGNG